MKKELALKASLLKSLNRIASTDETRYVINGVNVELDAKGYTLTATDGRRLITLHSDAQTFDEEISFTIPSLLIKALPDSMLSGRLPVLIDYNEKNISIRDCDLELRCLPIGGNYPNWRAVVPKEWPTGFKPDAIGLNYEYLTEIFETIKDLATNTRGVILAQEKETDPICILAPHHGDGELFAILMPVRFSETFAIPEFAKPEPATL